jgi:hypothetical protein
MTGPEHYREAERLLGETFQNVPNGDPAEPVILAEAQVHATLALAAATALGRYIPETGFTEADRRAWYIAASEGPGEKRRQREAEAAEFAEARGPDVGAA